MVGELASLLRQPSSSSSSSISGRGPPIKVRGVFLAKELRKGRGIDGRDTLAGLAEGRGRNQICSPVFARQKVLVDSKKKFLLLKKNCRICV